MVSPSVLDGHTNVSVSRNAAANATPSNFVISGKPADVANYAREGNNLIIEMKSGQIHKIKNFAKNGLNFNNLVLTDGGNAVLVDLQGAANTPSSNDGIVESLVKYHSIGAGISTEALLGIIGAAATVGVAIAASGGDDEPGAVVPTDTTAPDAPIITGFLNDLGSSATDGITSDNTLVFNGKAEANSSVEVFLNGGSIGTATSDGRGDWVFDYSGTALADGSYTVTAYAKDAAGNVSLASAAYELVIDTATRSVDIAGDGGDSGEITFTFSSAIDAASFTESDITVANGTLTSGSLTQVNAITWTAIVVPDLAEGHTNVAVTLAGGAVTSLSGGGNTEGRNTTTLANMFEGSSVTPSADITGWDTSHVVSIASAFQDNDTFNQDIGGWDTSNVTSMNSTFYGASAFNQDIGSWDTGNVTDINFLFADASAFDQDIGDWNTGNVTTMGYVFDGASAFDRNIGGWNTANVTNMSAMFFSATAFNQDVGGWDTSNVVYMNAMFASASSFNQGIGGWDTGNVIDMSVMFSEAVSFNGSIGTWDTSIVTNMNAMFSNATLFDQNVGGWDISSLTSAFSMFSVSGMSVANMDATIRGWAKLDTANGETAIQYDVEWAVRSYSDATALQYLIDHYNWIITGTLASGTIVGSNSSNDFLDQSLSVSGAVIHALGGDDAIIGSAFGDWIDGGSGGDMLTGGAGSDIFHYGFSDAGTDVIFDFENGTGGDVIHLSDLLIGYKPGTSLLSDYITATDSSGTDTILTIDYDGAGGDNTLVTIGLANVVYTSTLLDEMLANGNLMLS